MALIAMAVYSTEENKKDEQFERTLESLSKTVDFTKHRLMLSVNAFTDNTIIIIGKHANIIDKILTNDENIGTARAINKLWALRKPREHCIKMDDDIVINNAGWVDEMEWAIHKDPLIGQIGLKRKDCWEWPGHAEEDWQSELMMLPHIPGEPWVIVEKVKHVIGSCVMHNSALIDKVGYLYQPALYGYDDVIMSHRSLLAGFYNCFLPHVNIDHIDPGTTPYQDWKHKHSAEQTQDVIKLVNAMERREAGLYFDIEGKQMFK
jgi:GT2 family glycosyltransferase